MTNINQAVELNQNNNIDLPIHHLSVEQAAATTGMTRGGALSSSSSAQHQRCRGRKYCRLSLWLFLIKCSVFQRFPWRSGQAAPNSDWGSELPVRLLLCLTVFPRNSRGFVGLKQYVVFLSWLACTFLTQYSWPSDFTSVISCWLFDMWVAHPRQAYSFCLLLYSYHQGTSITVYQHL